MPVAVKPLVSSNPRIVDGDCLRLTQRPPIHGVGEPLRGMDVLLVRLTVRRGRSPGQVWNGVRAVGGWTGRSDPRPHIYSPRSFGSQYCRQWFRLSQMILGERFSMGLSGRWAKTHTKWANFLGPKSIGKGLRIFRRIFHEGRLKGLTATRPLPTRRAAEGIPRGFGASRSLCQMARGIGDDFKVHPWGNWRIGWVYPVIYIPIHCLYGFRVEQRDLQHKYVGKSLAITPLPTPTGQESPGKAHQLVKTPLESFVPPTGRAHPIVRPLHQLAKPPLSFVPSTNWRSLPWNRSCHPPTGRASATNLSLPPTGQRLPANS
jgi:hypothetical protein